MAEKPVVLLYDLWGFRDLGGQVAQATVPPGRKREEEPVRTAKKYGFLSSGSVLSITKSTLDFLLASSRPTCNVPRRSRKPRDMRAPRFRHFLSFGVMTTLVVPLASGLLGAQQGRDKEAGGKIAALVESLVSPNKEPKLVEGPRDLGVRHCQLPPKYDMAAQERIHETWDQLVAVGAEAFPSLIDHFDDKRYCTSAELDEWWSNYSVGSVCRQIVGRHIEPWGHFTIDPKGPTDVRPSYSDHHMETADAAKRWYASHKAKPLRDIQIEALQWTISQEKSRSRPRDTGDLTYLRGLLEKLRRSDTSLPPGGSYVSKRITDNRH